MGIEKIELWSGEHGSKNLSHFCEKCYSVYKTCFEFDYRFDRSGLRINHIIDFKCPQCGNQCVEIDENLIDIILRLNKIGLITRHCCEGHGFEDPAYISFDSNVELDKLPLNLRCPLFWERREGKPGSVIYQDRTSIVYFTEKISPLNCTRISEDYIKFDDYKALYLKSLNIWVEQLEKYMSKSEKKK